MLPYRSPDGARWPGRLRFKADTTQSVASRMPQVDQRKRRRQLADLDSTTKPARFAGGDGKPAVSMAGPTVRNGVSLPVDQDERSAGIAVTVRPVSCDRYEEMARP